MASTHTIFDALGCGCAPRAAPAAAQPPPPPRRRGRAPPPPRAAAGGAPPAPPPPPDGAAQRLSGGDGTNCGFQLNERYLEWDDSAAVRLLKLYIARETGEGMDWVDARLAELVVLLPGLGAKLARAQAGLVLALARDTGAAAERLLAAKAALGDGVDAAAVAAAHPWMLLDARAAPARLAAQMGELRRLLPRTDVAALVAAEPMLLLADVGAVLAELRRLLPPGGDAEAALARDPGAALDMRAAGLASSLAVDDGIEAA